MPRITVKDLCIKFRTYKNKSLGLKESFAHLLKQNSSVAFSTFKALDNVSFEINNGEKVGVIGSNGAGKTTLLKSICKIYEPTSGSINVSGKIVPILDLGSSFHPEFSGRENIYRSGAFFGISKASIREIEAEIILFSELEDFIDTPIKYYSTGMYTRLAFSLATAIKPEILILDEVFSAGDAYFISKAQKRMRSFIKSANIFLFVSHDEKLMRSLCDRGIWVDNGKIVADGNMDDVMDGYLEMKGVK